MKFADYVSLKKETSRRAAKNRYADLPSVPKGSSFPMILTISIMLDQFFDNYKTVRRR